MVSFCSHRSRFPLFAAEAPSGAAGGDDDDEDVEEEEEEEEKLRKRQRQRDDDDDDESDDNDDGDGGGDDDDNDDNDDDDDLYVFSFRSVNLKIQRTRPCKKNRIPKDAKRPLPTGGPPPRCLWCAALPSAGPTRHSD